MKQLFRKQHGCCRFAATLTWTRAVRSWSGLRASLAEEPVRLTRLLQLDGAATLSICVSIIGKHSGMAIRDAEMSGNVKLEAVKECSSRKSALFSLAQSDVLISYHENHLRIRRILPRIGWFSASFSHSVKIVILLRSKSAVLVCQAPRFLEQNRGRSRRRSSTLFRFIYNATRYLFASVVSYFCICLVPFREILGKFPLYEEFIG